MSIETRAAFEKVKPIILKLKRHYYIQLWDRDDWLQEGHIILLQLLDRKISPYFKEFAQQL
ncbi:ComX2 alternate sigma factor [Streptococcus pyogenes]|nr:ComX2 alternate sigma factor [Streptococcus pyogenes]VGW53599.1 ComX2 alternate sigma factor [Streptococcus pyogenes]VGW65517.1 ComX2 alternate sigma factor [Streptococcus pyogenes]VGW69952.1 ComX2 alternate sigma factor [Streptococcus pyogenes]VGW72895.1 ComX2 alternate sigma factor [Streptococcus pyogenes]